MSSIILIADDDPQIRRVLRASLTASGYECCEARTGLEVLEMIRLEKPDLVLLDFNMPEMNGLDACKSIRLGYQTPVIVLSVRDQEQDKVAILDAGANDYLTKPFSMPELLARIRVALRKGGPAEASVVSFSNGELEVDFQARRVKVRGKEVRLTPKELDLFRILIQNAGKPVAHRELLQLVWGPEHGQELEYLRVFINQLRKKVEPEPSEPRFIITEPWIGYRFEGIASNEADGKAG